MYYRGANAALLLYDITNASTFDDIRGWLEGERAHPYCTRLNEMTLVLELKKNCPPELIIYIVGSKADLHRHRQVTSDLARLSLHTWFPPPRPETPPPPPQPSTLSYIRPRFTSFTSIRSSNTTTPPPSTSIESPCLDPPLNRTSALKRSNTGIQSSSPGKGVLLSRSKTSVTGHGPNQTRFGSHFGVQTGGWNEIVETRGSSLNEEEEDNQDYQEWGLHKGMELFEVSAKDDLGRWFFLSVPCCKA
jgi:hypothetical protein